MLNKIFLASLLALTLSHASDEFSSERLLGIEVGYSDLSTNKSDSARRVQGAEFGLKIGAQNEEWRTTLSGSFFTKSGKTYQKAMLQFDHFVWNSLYKTDDIVFKPYLGAHVGWMKYTDDLSLSGNGLVYGAQAGVAWNVLDEVDFDLSYRYSLADIEQVDSISSVIFGVNYLY